jgi:hypothetical protein
MTVLSSVQVVINNPFDPLQGGPCRAAGRAERPPLHALTDVVPECPFTA